MRSCTLKLVFCILGLNLLAAIQPDVVRGAEYISEPFNPSWGIGILAPIPEKSSSHHLLPKEQLNLYDSPNGEIKYILWPETVEGFLYGSKEKVVAGKVNRADRIETDYEATSLMYFQRSGDFVQVLYHSHPGGFWLSTIELKNINFQAMDWLTFLLQNKIYYYPWVQDGIHLREQPTRKSKSIRIMKGDTYEIHLTGNTTGLWAEVQVIKYLVHPCSQADYGPSFVNKTIKYNGWIKILDDKGYPNIWFFTRGC